MGSVEFQQILIGRIVFKNEKVGIPDELGIIEAVIVAERNGIGLGLFIDDQLVKLRRKLVDGIVDQINPAGQKQVVKPEDIALVIRDNQSDLSEIISGANIVADDISRLQIRLVAGLAHLI